MKKQLLLFSTALLILTACSTEEETVKEEPKTETKTPMKKEEKPEKEKVEKKEPVKTEKELTNEEKLQELFEEEFKDKYESVMFNETGDKRIRVQLKNFPGSYGPAIRDKQIKAIAESLQLIKKSGIEADGILVATKYNGNNTIKAEFDISVLDEVDDDFVYRLHSRPEDFTTSYHEDNSIK